MIATLRRLWHNYLAGLPKSEVVDSIPESQWGRPDLLPPVSRQKAKAFAELLTLLHAHLDPGLAARLTSAGSKQLIRADEPDSALSAALRPDSDDMQQAAARGFIGLDWKATEELAWQADLLCRAHGLADCWAPPRVDGQAAMAQAKPGEMPVEPLLRHFGAWLAARGLALSYYADGDLLVAFAVRPAHRAGVERHLARLKIPFVAVSTA
jgi:hypothetical protein